VVCIVPNKLLFKLTWGCPRTKTFFFRSLLATPPQVSQNVCVTIHTNSGNRTFNLLGEVWLGAGLCQYSFEASLCQIDVPILIHLPPTPNRGGGGCMAQSKIKKKPGTGAPFPLHQNALLINLLVK
jgi:hypothetical protein